MSDSRPLPEEFPAGCMFFDVEDAAVVRLPGARWFRFSKSGELVPWREKFKGSREDAAAVVDRNGVPVSEAEFRRMCAAKLDASTKNI